MVIALKDLVGSRVVFLFNGFQAIGVADHIGSHRIDNFAGYYLDFVTVAVGKAVKNDNGNKEYFVGDRKKAVKLLVGRIVIFGVAVAVVARVKQNAFFHQSAHS